jgi:uncharacterized damage-inducible protein DinB
VSTNERRDLHIEPLPAQDPAIGRALWGLADARRRTLEVLEGLDEAIIDQPGPGGNAIGTILAHLTAIEVSWLYDEVLVQPYPPDMLAVLPPDVRDERGNLLAVHDLPLAEHLRRLSITSARIVEVFRPMALDDFRRPRSLPQYDVTPEWVLHHLAQHEAEHRADIGLIRIVLERESAIAD